MRLQLISFHKKELLSLLSSIKLVLIRYQSKLVCTVTTGPAPQGTFRGRTPLNESCAPRSEDCAPKKLIGSGLPEGKSRPETRKIVLIASEFVENRTIFGTKTRICEIFGLKTFFFFLDLFHLNHTLEFTQIKFSCPPKISLCPPVTLS